jgi:hypothetical protein
LVYCLAVNDKPAINKHFHNLDKIAKNVIAVVDISNINSTKIIVNTLAQDANLAPPGCTQWFFGVNGVNEVKTFNFEGGAHLADQRQNICIRLIFVF